MAMAPPGMDAKKVERVSTPDTRLRITAPSAPITKVDRVDRTMGIQ